MRDAVLAVGHGMGLLVLDHLQPMFQRAQIAIVALEFVAGLRRRRGRRATSASSAPCVDGDAQVGMAPAQDQLLGLGEEFDLADAAAPQLDVVARHRDLAMADMGMDLALDGLDVLDGGEIQIAPPDEGRDGLSGTARRSRDRRRRRAP